MNHFATRTASKDGTTTVIANAATKTATLAAAANATKTTTSTDASSATGALSTSANLATKDASATEIHVQLKTLVQTERKITQQILDLINQCELGRCFAKLGYSSMFEYLHKGLGYSEGSAQRRLSSARLLREMPDIKADLQTGELNLTQVSMAQIAIRREEKTQSRKMSASKKTEILERMKSKNTFERKAILASELPSFSDDGRDSVSPLKEDRVQITLTLSRAEFEQIKEAQDHLSNSVKSSELKDYLLYVTNRVLQKKRDLQKRRTTAATAVAWTTRVAKTAQISQTVPSKVSANDKRRPYITRSLKKHVLQKANYQCQYVSKETQNRCAATRYLHIDHIQPVAFNGSTSQENLRILCQAHNHLAAINSGLVSPRDDRIRRGTRP